MQSRRENPLDRHDLAASFQRAVSDTLVPRLKLAAEQTGVRRLVAARRCGGEFSARADLEKWQRDSACPIYMPPSACAATNAAMIGAQAYYEFLAGNTGTIWQNAFATAEISEKICQKNGIAKRRAKR